MKRIFTLLLSASLFPLLSMAQNVGVDVAVPVQKLDVAGGIKIGNTATGAAGSLRWDGTNIQYHDGTNWIGLVANSDNQTLSIALDQLAITGGNSVDLTPYLDNTDQQNLGLTGTSLSITGGTGVDLSPLQGQLIDDDLDTKVQVEESPDEDIIRFDIGGNERWVMRGSRLENAGTGNSVFVGQNAGANDDLATRNNTAVGQNALSTNTSGTGNAALGNGALRLSTSSNNTAVGGSALTNLAGGASNTAVGKDAGNGLTNGAQNVVVGSGTGSGVVGGSNNTMLGYRAGQNAGAASSGNVFLGNEAGFSETGNNKLYIDNSNTAAPLVYGEFDNNLLRVNGTLNINNAYSLPTTDGAAAGYVMSTDAAGNVTWTNPGLTGDITGVIAGAGLINGGTSGDVTIDANPDNSTIEVAADELRVKAEGITSNEIGTDAVNTDEIATGAVTTDEIAANTIIAADIATDAVEADEIATGAVTTDEILNATILPEDIDPAAGSANNVLSIVGGVAAWVDPATVNTTLQDTDTDTRIEVEQSADEDYIRMYTSNGTNSKETITIEPADAGTDAFAVGQVGIGTNTPDRDLHIAAPAGSQLLLSRGDITTSNGDILGELMFDSEDDSGPSSNTASAMIRGTATENHGNSNKGGMLSFYTKQNAGGGSGLAATERMRITQDGLVGITGTVRVTSLDQNANRMVYSDANGQLQNSTADINPNTLVDGAGATNRIAYWADANTLTSNGQLTYSGENLYVSNPEASTATVRLGAAWNRPGVYSSQELQLFSDETGIIFGDSNVERMRMTAAGDFGIGTNPASKLHVMGKTNIHQSGAGGGQNRFGGLEGPTTANGRAQLVLSSAYSDLVIASSQGNNNHGSTVSFAAYNPGNAGDYRKFVINQGNWGSRMHFLDFGYANAGGRSNPHANINSTDNVLTLDGLNKRVGINNMNPGQALDVNGNTRSTGNHYINNGSPTIYLQDSDQETGMIHMNSNLMYFLSGTGANSTSWAANGSYWPLHINMTNDDFTFGGRAFFMEGNVGIGTTNPTSRLDVEGDIQMNNNNIWSVNDMQVQTIYDNGGDIVHFDQNNGNLFRVRFDVGANNDIWMDRWDGNHPMIRPGLNGRGFNGKFNSYWYETYTLRIWRNQEYGFSDSRVKENIRSLSGTESLDKIMKLKGKLYDINRETHPQLGPELDLEEHVWKDNLGFIAQELMEVIPEMVILDENTGYYAIKNYEQMFPVVIEAMKEQQKQIEDLKAGGDSKELEALKAEIKELRSLLNQVLEK